MTISKSAASWKAPVLTAVLVLCYAAGSVLSPALVKATGGLAVMTLPGAFLAAGLLILPRRWAIACMLGCIVAGILARVASGTALFVYLYFPITLIGPVILALLARRFVKGLWITSLTRMGRLLAFAILPASTFVGLGITAIGAWLYKWPILSSMEVAIVADFLGTSIVLTGILVLGAPRKPHDIRHPWWEQVLLTGSFVGLSSIPFMLWGYPAGLVLIPAMTAFAFRYGPKATVISNFAVIAITVPMTVFVVGQKYGGMNLTGLLMVQQLTAACFFLGLCAALAVTHHRRLTRMLERRTDVARTARVEAIRASQAKTDFLATMSHEIRTPMNSILGFTQLMLRNNDMSETNRRRLTLVDRAGGALLTIVNDILDFSKVEAGEVMLSPRPVQMRAIAQDCLAIVAETARVKGLSLDLFVEGPADIHHRADDQRVRQVLLNLVNNAVKFTNKGGVRLEVRIIPGEDTDRVRFAVADTGAGIEPAAMSRLFKRFSQADSSVSRVHGGAGLGLAICKNLVELMGGQIGVQSTPGKGSTFWFELPVQRSRSAAPEQGEDQADLKAHVLLVDDHPMNRELGVAVLGLLGCEVDLAENGQQAIDAIKLKRYDVVLMDVHMPVMDGLAATRTIRALGGEPGATPIIAMSADVMPEQIELCRKAGMVDSVPKPIRIETLSEVLGRWAGVRLAADSNLAKAS